MEETMIKRLAGIVTAASLLLAGTAGVHAQGFPKGPITLVIPYAASDAADISARAMADEMSRHLKVPIVAVNRPGAGAALGVESVVKAGKDGYTILYTTDAPLTFRKVLYPETTAYDATKDLVPLGITTRIPIILAIRSDLPYKNFSEMIDYAKKNPGTVRVGTAGAGSVGDFTVAIVNSLTDAGIVMVPFKGAAPSVTAVRGGHVEGVALALGALSGHIKSGVLKGILISSKFPEFPDTPTLTELGYRQNLFGLWLGFYAPAGVPAEVAEALVPAVEKAARDPGIAAKLLNLGMVQEYAPPETMLKELREGQAMIEEIAKKSGIIK
jgi:tripartite-type tricarboxylate transporter receptor subunit TctC